MKKLIVWSLCLVMALSAFMPAWSAVMPSGAKDVYQGGRDRRPPPRGGRPHGGGYRPSPPPPRHHDRYYRDHRRHGSSGWAGFGVGAAIGTAIGAVVANSAPAPEPTMVYDPGCNCYYYR